MDTSRQQGDLGAGTHMTWIRHGQVHSDYQGRLYGSLDVPLSDEGQAQARAVARELRERPLSAVICSDLRRAQVTAELLCSSRPGLAPEIRPGLRERSRGAWAEFAASELDAQVPGARDLWSGSHGLFTPPDGETIGQVMDRVGAELAELLERYRGRSIAIVAHLWVVRSAVAWTLGLPASRVSALDLPTSGRAHLHWPEQSCSVADGRLVGWLGTPRVLSEDRLSG